MFCRKPRADDAAAAEDHRDVAVTEVPAVLVGSRAHLREALRVRANFAREQRFAHRFDEGRFVSLVRSRLRSFQQLACRDALFLHRGQEAGEYGFRDDGQRHAEVERALARPFARALLAGGVQDHVDHRLARFRIVFGEDVRRDLDQVAVEFALVPFRENLCSSSVLTPSTWFNRCTLRRSAACRRIRCRYGPS